MLIPGGRNWQMIYPNGTFYQPAKITLFGIKKLSFHFLSVAHVIKLFTAVSYDFS
jgi:hypothetical protein